jgi:hypothetical protein
MGAGDDRSSDDYHKRWDAIAAEQGEPGTLNPNHIP